MPSDLYLGIMSGTSLDGTDVAACRFDGQKIELLGLISTEWPHAMRKELLEFASADRVNLNRFVQAHFELANLYAESVFLSLKELKIAASDVRAIGLHGQTVRHLPGGRTPATFQLGSGAALAAITEIDVVSDFRAADIAAGGQGAPLVPSFDYYFLTSNAVDRLILNIGGIANVTWLPAQATADEVLAFDCGPGNMMMDAIAERFFAQPFDTNGDLARMGTIDEELLARFLAHPFFSISPPKSTGRELFSEKFLAPMMEKIIVNTLSPLDALATLAELTARAIAMSFEFLDMRRDVEMVVSGGGAFNGFLMERLNANAKHIKKIGDVRITRSDEYGIPSKAKEAIAFAFFAKAFIEEIPIHLPRTTGAHRHVTLGSLSKGK